MIFVGYHFFIKHLPNAIILEIFRITVLIIILLLLQITSSHLKTITSYLHTKLFKLIPCLHYHTGNKTRGNIKCYPYFYI